MALDEPRESDTIFEHDDVSYLVDQALVEKAGDIFVDFVEAGVYSGFKVSSSNPVASYCSPGGGCCG